MPFWRRRNFTGVLAPDDFAPQSRGKKDWDFDMLGLSSASSEPVNLEQHATVLSQGRTNSCVAHAWEQALVVEARALKLGGDAENFGSRLFDYYNSRAGHGGTKSDTGTFLRTMANGLRKVGRVDEKYWKFRPMYVNRRPSTRAYQKAHGFRGLKGHYRIYDTGAKRVEAIMTALSAGHCVIFGMSVDRPFTRNDGPDVISIPTSGEYVGGHAMCIVGWRVKDGKLQFRVVNSWGTDWRDGGMAWFDEELMQWQGIVDCWVGSLV